MDELCRVWFQTTPQGMLTELSRNRGIPVEALNAFRVSWNGYEWVCPAYNDKGNHVRNIYRWEEGRFYATAGLPHVLLNWEDLGKRTGRVWVCEGHWDTYAWRWYLSKAKRNDDAVVGVPGVDVFPKEWATFFSGREVCWVYDNDKPGLLGMWKASQACLKDAKSQKFIHWQAMFKDGFDIRDAVKGFQARGISPGQGVATIESWLKPDHPRVKELSPSQKNAPAKPVLTEKPPTFEDILAVFSKWLKLTDDFIDAMAVSLAVAMGNGLPGVMLWLHLAGAASSGKSEILRAMSSPGATRVHFESSIRPKALISGWSEGPDTSLLPKFKDKTVIIADSTLIFGSRPEDRRDVFSTFREVYDGVCRFTFGNGKQVELPPGTKFNMIWGVTTMVHGEDQTEMGERFIRFHLRETFEEQQQKARKAITNENTNATDVQKSEELTGIMNRFLAQEVPPLVEIPEEFIARILALGHLVAYLRASVPREHTSDRDIRYEPETENPSRLSRQFLKLMRLLCFVLGKAPCSEIYSIVRRVAFDTCNQFHLKLVKTLVTQGKPMSYAELGGKIGQPAAFVRRKMEDLEILQAVIKEHNAEPRTGMGIRGQIPWTFKPTMYMKELWNASKVFPK